MGKLNVAYCGNIAEVADEIFLSENFNLVEVFVEKGKVSSEMLTFSYLRKVPLNEVSGIKELEAKVAATKELNCLIVCGFGVILSASLLNKIKAFNFHPGTLPDFKGRHPIFFATLAGEKHIGVTLHEITPGIDEGNIIALEKIKYRFRQTEVDIMQQLPQAVERLLPKLSEFIQHHKDGMENVGGHYYKPVSEEDITFSKEDEPSRILQIMRAQARYGGGIFKNGNQTYRVKTARVVPISSSETNRDGIVYRNDELYGIAIGSEYCVEFGF